MTAPLPDVASSTTRLVKTRRHAQLTAGLVATVVFLTAIAQLATDMYVPAFPQVAALFAYVATSAFILQTMNGLSPIAYSIDFAANAAGMTVAALIAARLAGRIATRKVILAGQVAALSAGVAMLVGAVWLGTPLSLAIVCFFVLMAAQGLIIPNGGALASAAVPEHPGTGSAVQGFVQWVATGVIAPLAGLGGDHTAAPMATLTLAGAGASMLGLLVSAKPSSAGSTCGEQVSRPATGNVRRCEVWRRPVWRPRSWPRGTTDR